ncbi:MAG: Rrf2 family transcriptional regulator [Phycisphaeraceae bacterium]|nr:Rrf2 family transcriptional regulator [Phycisphaeraceae bacterium]
MLTLSRKVDYALVAMAGLVELEATDEQPVSASRLCEHYHLPTAMAMNILKVLQHAGLIGSTRGASGGYYPLRSASWISLLDVIEAVEGPIRVAACCGEDAVLSESVEASDSPRSDTDSADSGEHPVCAMQPACPITHRIQAVNRRIQDMLRQTTIRDLLDEPSVPVSIGSRAESRSPNRAGRS